MNAWLCSFCLWMQKNLTRVNSLSNLIESIWSLASVVSPIPSSQPLATINSYQRTLLQKRSLKSKDKSWKKYIRIEDEMNLASGKLNEPFRSKDSAMEQQNRRDPNPRHLEMLQRSMSNSFNGPYTAPKQFHKFGHNMNVSSGSSFANSFSTAFASPNYSPMYGESNFAFAKFNGGQRYSANGYYMNGRPNYQKRVVVN